MTLLRSSTVDAFTRLLCIQKIPALRFISSTGLPSAIDKVYPSAAAAIDDIRSNSTILCGGFGLLGIPGTLLRAITDRPDKTEFAGVAIDGGGLRKLLETKQVRKIISSYVGENKTFEMMYLNGELEVELTPQRTLIERCRAGAAVHTGGMTMRYNPDGSIAQKSHTRPYQLFNGVGCILEKAIRGDYALVKAYKADKHGNCVFRLAANNSNAVMARNAAVTIVETEHIVEVGQLDPASIHVPGIYVDRVVQSTVPKQIEKYTFAKDLATEEEVNDDKHVNKRERIVRRAAKELQNGMYANLGVGMPMLIPNFVPADVNVIIQSENGILGLGPYPQKGKEDPDLINAGNEIVTLNPGAAVFGSEDAFTMIRGGKIDLTLLGAMQVNEYGDLASWFLPGKVRGMGGAMDLVSQPGRTKVVVTMEHVDKKGGFRIVKECTFPLTGSRCVSRIITDLGVFDMDHLTGLRLIEKSMSTMVDEIRTKTGVVFEIANNLKNMEE